MANHMTLALCSWPICPLKSSLLSGLRVDLVCVFRCATSFPVPTWTPHGNLAILGAMLGTIGNETVNPRVFAWTRLARWLTDASARHPPQLIIRCLCLRNPRRQAERYGLWCQARYNDWFAKKKWYVYFSLFFVQSWICKRKKSWQVSRLKTWFSAGRKYLFLCLEMCIVHFTIYKINV